MKHCLMGFTCDKFSCSGRKEPYSTSVMLVVVMIVIFLEQGSGFLASALAIFPCERSGAFFNHQNNHSSAINFRTYQTPIQNPITVVALPSSLYRLAFSPHSRSVTCKNGIAVRFSLLVSPCKANSIAGYLSRLSSLGSHPMPQRKSPPYHDLRFGDSEPFAGEVRLLYLRFDAGAYRISWTPRRGNTIERREALHLICLRSRLFRLERIAYLKMNGLSVSG